MKVHNGKLEELCTYVGLPGIVTQHNESFHAIQFSRA